MVVVNFYKVIFECYISEIVNNKLFQQCFQINYKQSKYVQEKVLQNSCHGIVIDQIVTELQLIKWNIPKIWHNFVLFLEFNWHGNNVYHGNT